MAIEAGKLRHRCELYSVNRDNRDASGQKVPAYVLVRPFWAEILTAKQVQQRIANGMEYPNATTFHCRFMPGTDVTPDMAVLYKGKYYDIEQVENPKGLNIELYIMAGHKL
ncbi:phage head closure protein [Arsukibacterium sp.]|uniref:phage head closure protein n=1 Tax=Arsukibacterium sp. TaxID=1977258 RepID=UPI00299F26AA|nr:phage head closure protein [Arsukibacterium sp.]MDX1538830.1 phage head closure protein [Arsukibacterium sp.]